MSTTLQYWLNQGYTERQAQVMMRAEGDGLDVAEYEDLQNPLVLQSGFWSDFGTAAQDKMASIASGGMNLTRWLVVGAVAVAVVVFKDEIRSGVKAVKEAVK